MDDKPEGAKLGWRIVASAYPFATPWMRLRQDRIAIAGKGDATYTYEERADAVGIVPVTRDGTVLLIRQYRYPLDRWCLEIPAGGMRDHPDATPEDVARIELREEVGATCAAMLPVGFFYVAVRLAQSALPCLPRPRCRRSRRNARTKRPSRSSSARCPSAMRSISPAPGRCRRARAPSRYSSARPCCANTATSTWRGNRDIAIRRSRLPSRVGEGPGVRCFSLLRASRRQLYVHSVRIEWRKRERSQRCRSDRCERSTP